MKRWMVGTALGTLWVVANGAILGAEAQTLAPAGTRSQLTTGAPALSGQAGQSAAPAQSTAPPFAPDDSAPRTEAPTKLEEIVVTAQRRSEAQQHAAVAVDVISPATLARAQITQPSQLTNIAPALQTASVGGTNTSFYIRGVGTFTANPYTDSAIAFNVDGVFLAHPNATTGYFYDLARIEVVKGPQGTLYGRNATGGAINVIPQVPKLGGPSGYISLAYGNYNYLNVEGAVNIPVTNNSALRMSGTYTRHDAYLNDGTDSEDTGSFRGQYLIQPTDGLRIRLSADYTERQGAGTSGTLIGSTSTNPFTNMFSVTPSGLSPNLGTYDTRSAQYYASVFDPISGRPNTDYTIRPSNNGNFVGLHGQLDYETPVGHLTILPAYVHGRLDDVDAGTGFPYLDQEVQDQTSVEARLSGKLGRLDYLGGLYYFNDTDQANYDIYEHSIQSYQKLSESTASHAAFGRLTFHVADDLRLVAGYRYTQDNKTFDGTADTLIDACTAPTGVCPGSPLLPQLPTIAGVIRQLGLFQVAPGVYIAPSNPNAVNSIFLSFPLLENKTLSEGKSTFHAGIEYDVAPKSLLYANFETGFRSGGFSFSEIAPQYEPETITAYTLGSKNRFLDDRLQINVEGFWWKYNNQQVAHNDTNPDGTPAFDTTNIGRSTNRGFEVEGQYLVTPDTLALIDAQYLDAVNKSFSFREPGTVNPVLSTPDKTVYFPIVTTCPTRNAGKGFVLVNCDGTRPLVSPLWTLNFGVQQTVHLGEGLLVLGADTRYQTSDITGFERLPIEVQPAYWTTNLDISYTPPSRKYTVMAFANNLQNHRVETFSAAMPLNLIGATFSAPLTVGARVNYKF